MSLETLYLLAKALDCSVDKLLGLELRERDRLSNVRELLALAEELVSEEIAFDAHP